MIARTICTEIDPPLSRFLFHPALYPRTIRAFGREMKTPTKDHHRRVGLPSAGERHLACRPALYPLSIRLFFIHGPLITASLRHPSSLANIVTNPEKLKKQDHKHLIMRSNSCRMRTNSSRMRTPALYMLLFGDYFSLYENL